MIRETIREAIKVKTGKNCGDNFTILEEKDGRYKVEVLWTRGKTEILEIKLKNNETQL